MSLNTPPAGQLAVSTVLNTATNKTPVADGGAQLAPSGTQPMGNTAAPKAADTTVLTVASALPTKLLADSEVVVARILATTLLPANSTNLTASSVTLSPAILASTMELEDGNGSQAEIQQGKNQQIAPNKSGASSATPSQLAQKQWLIELQLPSKNGPGAKIATIGEKALTDHSLVLLRASGQPTASNQSAKPSVSKLVATPIPIELKLPKPSANDLLAALKTSDPLLPARVTAVKKYPAGEIPPGANAAQRLPNATSDKLNPSAPIASPKSNAQTIHVASMKLDSADKAPPLKTQGAADQPLQTPIAGEKITGIPSKPERWQIDITVIGPKGEKHDLQLVTAKPIPVQTNIAIDTSAASEKSNTQTAFSQITTIISESLKTAELEGKSITQLAQLNTAILANSQSNSLLGAKIVQNLQTLANFGISKDSNIKELVGSLGVFAKTDKVPDNTATSAASGRTEPRLAGVKQGLPSNHVPGLENKQSDTKPEQTVKEQITALISQLMANSMPTANTANSARRNNDPLLILIELLSKPITGGLGDKGSQNVSDSEAVREQVARVLKQVLLGMQGASVRNLADRAQNLDGDSQQNSVLNIELPIHWTNSTGKAVFKVQNRDGRQDDATDDGAAAIKTWQFELTMDFPEDRVMTTRCTLNKQSARLQIWASTAEFKNTIEQRLQTFKTKLENDGITLDYCGCALGTAPNSPQSGYFQTLVDTKA